MVPELFPNEAVVCIIPGYRGKPVEIQAWGNNMRKVALLAAVVLSAAFSNISTSYAADEDIANLNRNTFLFLGDLFNPAATAQPAAAPAPAAEVKVAKKKKSKK